MATLIINADDLGVAPSTDAGILRAHSEGLVTSTTALATSERFAQALGLAAAQGLPVGLHLNLTLGRCVAPVSDVPLLADEAGYFRLTSRHLPRLLGGRRPDPALLAQVRTELAAQFARAADSGVAMTHCDSHQHVHMIPAVFALVAELAPRYGVTRTRLAAEPLTAFHLRHKPLGVLARNNVLKWLWLRWAARSLRGPLAVPDAYFGVFHSGLFDAATLRGIVRTLRPGTVSELGVHPGLPPEPGEADYPQPYSNDFIASPLRQRELAALTDPESARVVREAGVRLASFADLDQPGGRHAA